MVDNGSTDATLDIIKRFPNIEIYSEANRGFAGGCNRGIQIAGSDYEAYFFLNPDARVTPTCLHLLMEALDEDAKFAVVSPTIFDPESGQVQYAGASLDFETMNFAVLTSQEIVSEGASRETGRPSGAAMLVRRTSLEVVGPMDDSYFLYWEECEWAARFHSRGWKIGYVPSAEVFHSSSHSTGGTGSKVYEYYYTRNVLRLVSEYKHFSRPQGILHVLPFIVRRLWTITSRRHVRRLLDAIRFDALGVLDFLRGRTGHRVGLPPISVPSPLPE